MSIEKKKLTVAMTSVLGVLVVAALLIALNLVFSTLPLRWDCTEGKIYTLSQGTRELLGKLDKTVTIRFYYTKDSADMPVFLKTYAGRVTDLLQEYRRCNPKFLDLKTLNPKPDSNEEDSAKLDGISGQAINPMTDADPIYLGIAVACGDKTAALPFLNPEKENLLEYELSRAISEVLQTKKTRLGILSPLKVMGGIDNPQLMMSGQGGMKPAWTFVKELKRTFNVSEVALDAESIDPDIDLLLVLHPRGLSEKTMFAIDQFVLRGGRLAAFVDPFCMVDMQQQQQQQYMPPEGSSLPQLFQAWGVTFEPLKVVVDRTLAFRSGNRYGGEEILPTVLNLTRQEISKDDVVSASLNSMLLFGVGAFAGQPAEGLTKTVLLTSSEDSELQDCYMTQRSGREILQGFHSDEQSKALAIRLTGHFHTAFPDGAPGQKENEPPAQPSLKESTKDGAVLLVADADFIYDAFCVQKTNFLGQEVVQLINDNLNFLQNNVENLCGDSSLFQIRSRAVDARPFERVRELQAQAERQYQDRIQKLEHELQSVRQEISKLQHNRQKGDKELLSAEQREVLRKFRQKEVAARKELKEVRKQLRQDIDSLENNLMVANIALMPVLVIIVGIGLAWSRRRQR